MSDTVTTNVPSTGATPRRLRRTMRPLGRLVVALTMLAGMSIGSPADAAKPPPPTGSDCADVRVQSITEGIRFKVKSDKRCTDFPIQLRATAQVNGSIIPLYGPTGPAFVEVTPGGMLKYDWDLSEFFDCDGSDYRFTIDAWVHYGPDIIAEAHNDSLRIKC